MTNQPSDIGLSKTSDWANPDSAIRLYMYRIVNLINVAEHYKNTGELISDDSIIIEICEQLDITPEKYTDLQAWAEHILASDERFREFFAEFMARISAILESLDLTDSQWDDLIDAETKEGSKAEQEINMLRALWDA
jgi:hypothetical protein